MPGGEAKRGFLNCRRACQGDMEAQELEKRGAAKHTGSRGVKVPRGSEQSWELLLRLLSLHLLLDREEGEEQETWMQGEGRMDRALAHPVAHGGQVLPPWAPGKLDPAASQLLRSDVEKLFLQGCQDAQQGQGASARVPWTGKPLSSWPVSNRRPVFLEVSTPPLRSEWRGSLLSCST